jgi:hypothetical protein
VHKKRFFAHSWNSGTCNSISRKWRCRYRIQSTSLANYRET